MKPGCGLVARAPRGAGTRRDGGALVYPGPPMTARRRPAPRRRARGRLMAASLVLASAVAALGGLWFDRSSNGTASTSGATTPPPTTAGASHTAKPALRLTVSRAGRLPAAVQDSAVTVIGDTAYVFGGLDAAGSSVGTVSRIRGSSIRTIGQLPVPLHDAAAATVAGRLYVLGGGHGRQLGDHRGGPDGGRADRGDLPLHTGRRPGAEDRHAATAADARIGRHAQWRHVRRWGPRRRQPATEVRRRHPLRRLGEGDRTPANAALRRAGGDAAGPAADRRRQYRGEPDQRRRVTLVPAGEAADDAESGPAVHGEGRLSRD